MQNQCLFAFTLKLFLFLMLYPGFSSLFDVNLKLKFYALMSTFHKHLQSC